MSKSALVLKFPTGDPLTPEPETEPRRHPRWRGWLGAVLAVAVIIGTAIGAFRHSDSSALTPPGSPVLSGLQSVFSAQRFCGAHPNDIVRARVKGVFYSGVALEAVTGALFNGGGIPPEVTLAPQNYRQYAQYRPVLVTAWPGYEALLPASAWVTVSGVLSCSRQVSMQYVSYRPSSP
jgi:hypothetical protein